MQTNPNTKIHLRTAPAAAHCGSTKSTFEKYRLTGEGPCYSKIGRIVIYNLEDLDAWIESKKRASTSECLSGKP